VEKEELQMKEQLFRAEGYGPKTDLSTVLFPTKLYGLKVKKMLLINHRKKNENQI
jgi:hypothetical protein